MKTKIVGIALATIILASAFAAMAPTVSSVGTQNTDHNIIGNGTNTVLIGQKLDFTSVGLGKAIIGISPDSIKGKTYGTTSADYDTGSYFTETGLYYADINGDTQYNVSSGDVALSLDNTIMKMDLKVGTKSVSSIAQGTAFNVSFTNNLDGNDAVSLKVQNPDGNILKTNPIDATQAFDNITASGQTSSVKNMVVQTTDGTNFWKIGTYTIWIETIKERARGLTGTTNTMTLQVIKSTIDISADKTSVAELGTVTLTVSGSYNHHVYVNTSDSLHTLWQFGVNDYTAATVTTNDGLYDTIDEDGVRKYAVKFNDTGSYTIEVKDVEGQATDSIDITVSEKKITFDVPATVVIGQKLTVKGTTNAGSTISIAFADIVPAGWGSLTVDANKEFSKDIETGGKSPSPALMTPGSVRIDAFIDRNFAGSKDTSKETEDGSTTILLVSGDLTAELSTDAVAVGDEFVVSGKAQGAKNVEILSITPKGASGKGLRTSTGTAYSGITYDKTSVSETDYTFSKKLDVRSDADTGIYLIAVLTPGIDGHYGGTTSDNVITAIGNTYGTLGTKTLDQMVAIIEDMVTTAGSDDLLFVARIKVETARVTLDPVATVGVGEPLVVTGTSNRKEGFAIVLTVKGPVELAPKTISLEADGTFNATFDTTGAKEGTYTVKADDGDGHTDETTVNIGAAKPATPTPTATPTATATATPTVPPTATPATPTPATPTPATPTPKQPGFEAVFAIAGLLAIAYLVLRIRK
jgi:PGF-CTERM protein